MKPIVIVKTGYTDKTLVSSTGDFEHWVMKSAKLPTSECLVINAQLQPEYPAYDDISGIIVTGSHDDVTDAKPWMVHLSQWLKNIPDGKIPTLGICFGHQLLASAYGGKVGDHPNGGEYGLIKVNVDTTKIPDDFFMLLPHTFDAFASHEQTVTKLPEGAFSFGSNSHDANHLVQYRAKVWGFQFHPEFTDKITKHYSKNQKEAVTQPAHVMAKAELTGYKLMAGFVLLCKNHS
jgi:GMP synthase (glutamine-hydrolysing)